MKTFKYILLVTLFLSFSSVANAIPVTWTDTINAGQWISAGSTFNFDLASDPLVSPTPYAPGIDSIYSATLNINLLGLGIGQIVIDNLQTQNYAFLIYTDLNIPLTGMVVNDLSTTGLLQVVFDRNARWPMGCQWLTSMTLTACGNDNSSAPVPEPATLLLLGSGFMGLAFFGRRFIKR
jgi:hypothetical protein